MLRLLVTLSVLALMTGPGCVKKKRKRGESSTRIEEDQSKSVEADNSPLEATTELHAEAVDPNTIRSQDSNHENEAMHSEADPLEPERVPHSRKTAHLALKMRAADPTHDLAHVSVGPKRKNSAEDIYHQAVSALRAAKIREASDLYLTSCQMGFIISCHRYGWHMEHYEENFEGAQPFYTLACIRGIAKSCNNLGFQAEKAQDFKVAREFYDMACELKHKRSCKNLQRLEKPPGGIKLPAH